MFKYILENPLKIHCCYYQENIYPWIQKNLYTPFWRFYYNTSHGGFLRLSDGTEMEMTPDFFYIIPGYMRFSTFAEKPFDQFFIHFNLSDRQKNLDDIYKFAADSTNIDIINNYINRTKNPNQQQLNYLSAVSVLTSTLLKMPEIKLTLPQSHSPGIEKVLRIMDNSMHNKDIFDNEKLAEIAGMSRASFISLFKKETGETPQAYLRRKKIENACKLLNYTNLSLEEIADVSGFANRYHFTRVFSELMKMPPAHFRKKLANNQTMQKTDKI